MVPNNNDKTKHLSTRRPHPRIESAGPGLHDPYLTVYSESAWSRRVGSGQKASVQIEISRVELGAFKSRVGSDWVGSVSYQNLTGRIGSDVDRSRF